MKLGCVLYFFFVCAAAVTIHQVKNTRQCKTEGGTCKQTCAVDEEDTGPCCRNSYRCCQPPYTLQYAECKIKNGKSKHVCDVNEQDTGRGPFCNTNRCCEPPTCIAKADFNCKITFVCLTATEYEDIAGNCSGSDKCCKPCCRPEGSFTSPHYPSNYCDEQLCTYTIIVEEGSKVMLNFTFFKLEDSLDKVWVYDGKVSRDALLATLDGGPFEGLEFNSTSNKMIVVFNPDVVFVDTGFSAIYKTLQ